MLHKQRYCGSLNGRHLGVPHRLYNIQTRKFWSYYMNIWSLSDSGLTPMVLMVLEATTTSQQMQQIVTCLGKTFGTALVIFDPVVVYPPSSFNDYGSR